ncbi:hypothetical protein, partial [Chryseobacterium contaminans]|uniref:hypothetical protein n=1 Tax=Chryseobacterium contaminans TaxID=1423959 RepID=UPI001E60EFAD
MSFIDSEKLEGIHDVAKLDNQVVDERFETIVSDVSVDAKAEKSLVRKLDIRILPILCIMYLAACELNHMVQAVTIAEKHCRSG